MKIDTQKEYINKLQERSEIEIQSEIESYTQYRTIDKYNTHIQCIEY